MGVEFDVRNPGHGTYFTLRAAVVAVTPGGLVLTTNGGLPALEIGCEPTRAAAAKVLAELTGLWVRAEEGGSGFIDLAPARLVEAHPAATQVYAALVPEPVTAHPDARWVSLTELARSAPGTAALAAEAARRL